MLVLENARKLVLELARCSENQCSIQHYYKAWFYVVLRFYEEPPYTDIYLHEIYLLTITVLIQVNLLLVWDRF